MKSYEKHMKIFVGLCIYKCKDCNKMSDSDGILKRHINNCHEKGEVCFQ